MDTDTMEQLCEICQLALSSEEKNRLARDLAQDLQHLACLQEMERALIPLSSPQPHPLPTCFREDEPLVSACGQKDGLYQVPKII